MQTVEIAVTYVHSTSRAVLVNDGIKEIWVPFSLIEDLDKSNIEKISEITVPEWFALKEGLI